MAKTTRSRFAAVGNGLLNGLVIAADLPTLSRMTEIEREIDELQKDYARLNEKLSESHQRPVPYQK